MDLSTIQEKIMNCEYGNLTDFEQDMKLMCNNAILYNGSNTTFYKKAEYLLEKVATLIREIDETAIFTVGQDTEFHDVLDETIPYN